MLMSKRCGIRHWAVLLTGLMLFLPQVLRAQEDTTRIVRDSLRLQTIEREPLLAPVGFELPSVDTRTSLPPLTHQPTDSLLRLPLEKPIALPYYTNPSPLFRGDYATGGLIGYSRHAVLYGAGSQTTLPGIGILNQASLMYGISLGDQWEVQGGIGVTKMNVFPAIGQTFNASAALMYHLSDRVRLKGFGSYAAGQLYAMPAYSYGGTIGVDVTDRFSLEGGVRRYYDPMRGGWQTAPVLIPSYRFDKFKLEMDVGGLLYELLRNGVKRDYNRANSTIGPPRTDLPIRPR